MPPKPFDVKQVAKLFDDTLSQIRAENGNLRGDAVNWLKAARKQLMQDLEKKYYELAASAGNPLSRPAWADGVTALGLSTTDIPSVLMPYAPAFTENLQTLLPGLFDKIYIYIKFPPPPPGRAKPLVVPKTMEVDDEFSKFSKKKKTNKKGGALAGEDEDEKKPFMAKDFGQLLTNVREGTMSEAPEDSLGGKLRRSGVKKEEEDPDGRRLRSATRASSTATVRSERASTRKKAKLA